MIVADPTGTWFQSAAAYPLHDPISGITFQPGEITRATATDWVKLQPTISACADPLAPVANPVAPTKVEKPAK